MPVQLMKEYKLGDMKAEYLLDSDNGQVGFRLLPYDMRMWEYAEKAAELEPLVQLKVTGDIYNAAYAMGATMRNSETVRRMKYHGQSSSETEDAIEINTVLEDDRGYRATHCLRWKYDTPYVRIKCLFENLSAEPCTLEMLESFSLGGLSPYLEGDGHGQLMLHRIRSVWSMEGRHERIPAEELQLEPAWAPHAVRCERFGQAGSMPVNRFFPFAAVEDTQNHVFWGAQIAHNASWQMELYRKDDGLSLSGGLADRELGHWMKEVKPGECFSAPEAIVTTVHTDSFDVFTGRLTQAALEGIGNVPDAEQELPMVFNEYCTTWGSPSHENILKILGKIKDKDFRYFVIDCGWYKAEGVPWDISMGDYEVSETLFPDGLEKTVSAIKSAGMIPGLWFEIENVGSASKAYHMKEHLLHKDGKVLTSYFRRFWDMQDPWVEQYLTEKVIGTLKKYGFGYMKIDYNETIGIGCDGEESPGEGLRKNMEASAAFIEKVKREIPDIVLENCASGGHRLEPGLMAQMSMASFSDAHECAEIPIIAANLHRVIHPRQSQIWAVIRKEDSLKRIAYSLANTFLGRLCISGDVTELSDKQWDMIDRGMDFYKRIVPVIRDGQSYIHGNRIESMRHPCGWQGVVRVGRQNKAYVVIHTFEEGFPEWIEISLPAGCPQNIGSVYSDTEEEIAIEAGILKYRAKEKFKGVAVELT